MRAAILRNGSMVVDDLPDLTPGPGQVLVEPIACGICGSDLHTVGGAHEMVAAAHEAGHGAFIFDPDQDLVMGHELSVRVLAAGSGVSGLTEGAAYAAIPMLNLPGDQRALPGYDNTYPGGYSSQMLLDPAGLLPVSNGLDPKLAALTEPLAVGLHAVNESAIGSGRIAIVVGCGPVGLAIVASLAAQGTTTIIAADYSPTRRATAGKLGAHVVADPAEASVFDAWRDCGDAMTPPVVFEAVGVPGVIDQIMRDAPPRSEIVIVGVCMQPDTFRPTIGVFKHLTMRFVLGWSPEEFATSLTNLSEGHIDGSVLVTGEVGIDGVPQAFTDLADPEQHVKILVRPDLG
ncbi:MAG: zinc-binding dehydrogenase [Actinomycetia bacterium]|nr:zinc-binding dehydrogenase [Actinomycetes bacterium]MCP4958682.1 zinc-binding dehydrogenase [Actinomycetes bacterium]